MAADGRGKPDPQTLMTTAEAKLEAWLDVRLGERIAWPFPAWRTGAAGGDVTWCASTASRLDEMRQTNGEEPLLPPVVPIIAIDGPMRHAPRGRWVRVTRDGARVWDGAAPTDEAFPVPLEEYAVFNELCRALPK